MAKSAPEAGLKIGGLDPLLGAGCFLLAMPLVQVVAMISEAIYRQVNGAEPPVLAHDTLKLIVDTRGDVMVWLLIAAVVIGAPIVEELIFRGGLQSAILKLTGSPWAAVLGTSTLFALMHLSVVPADGRFALAPLFALSVAMGLAFERTKRLGVPIVMHMCYNGLTVLLALTLADPSPANPVAGR
jgi:membrane protease YdiL (CAAX protease family)